MTPLIHSILMCVRIFVALRSGTRSMFWRLFVVGCNGTVGCNGDRWQDEPVDAPTR